MQFRVNTYIVALGQGYQYVPENPCLKTFQDMSSTYNDLKPNTYCRKCSKAKGTRNKRKRVDISGHFLVQVLEVTKTIRMTRAASLHKIFKSPDVERRQCTIHVDFCKKQVSDNNENNWRKSVMGNNYC